MSNRITITGRLASDPELRFAKTGTAMCNISVPDQKRRKNDRGEWEDASATTWFRVTVFKDAAEALAEKARKGDTVVVFGELITREWTNQSGEVKQSLEVDFATVAVVPSVPKAERSYQGQGQGDPWAQQVNSGRANASGWGAPAEAPF